MVQGKSWLAGGWCCAVMAAAVTGLADIRLPALFSDHMVLQRDVPLPVWGWASPGAVVRVRVGELEATEVTADSQGRWLVRLPPLNEAGRIVSLTAAAGATTQTIHDAVVGDVWLCSGQSNMRRPYRQYSTPEERQTDSFPLIRHFDVAIKEATSPCEDMAGAWGVCASNTVGGFTGAGYYFARKIHQETGVPIGILHSSLGSTKIEAWFEPGSVTNVPELTELLPAWQAESLTKVRGPFCLYNGMIHPLVPFAIRGVLWYQGEGNGSEGEIYYHKMRALIGGWRAVWKQGDFPFYFVQLPGYHALIKDPAGADPRVGIRAAQERALEIPYTGMAVTLDIGLLNDNHPTNKKDVGERLARWALRNEYNRQAVEYSGPVCTRMEQEGGNVRLFFDHADGGLVIGRKDGTAPVEEIKGSKCPPVSAAGADGRWQWAEAVVDGATLVITLPGGNAPVNIRYGCHGIHPDNIYLYNRAGLPMLPFRISR